MWHLRLNAQHCGLALTGNIMEALLTRHGKVQTQGQNIRNYASYLSDRAKAYRDTKCDYVRGAEHRLEKLSVEKGLLRETEIVQYQINSLLKCDVRYNVYIKMKLADFVPGF